MNKIAILLSTYNGEKYIREQLDSLFAQTYKNFEIIARDDKSNDSTLEILKSYNIKLMDANINLGAQKNFSTLLEYALENSDAEYFMFCDQDDVWDIDKIKRTLSHMHEMEKARDDIPLLVHTDLAVVDDSLKIISKSMWEYEYIFPQYNSFNRLLIQNTITGCTVMINRKLAIKSLPIPDDSIMHDYWIGLVASYFGQISYIKGSTIKYRQHDNNAIGAKNRGDIKLIRSFLGLCISLIKRDKKYLIQMTPNLLQAKSFLKLFAEEIDGETKDMLNDFIAIKESSFYKKRKTIFKHKLYKQTNFNNLALWIKL